MGDGIIGSQPLSDNIRGAPVPETFKHPSLAMFDGRSDPYEHVTSINTLMPIVRVFDSLMYKFLFGTSRDASLQWYMGLLHACITSYQELVRKIMH